VIPAYDTVGYAHRIESLLNYPEISCRVREQAYTKTIKEHNWHTYMRLFGCFINPYWTNPLMETSVMRNHGVH